MLVHHAGVPFFPGGYVGVDVFFVISGFLITKHLLEDLDRHGRIDFVAFYARRARRLLPAALAVIVLTIAAAVIWVPPLLLRKSFFVDAVATTWYVPNFLFARRGTDYLAEPTPSLFQQYWSLGVEEQFYLLWPVVLLGAVGLRRSGQSLVWVLASLVVVSFTASVAVSYWRQPLAFFLLPTRAWEFGVGALAALAVLGGRAGWGRPGRAVAGWVGVALIVVAGLRFSDSTIFPGYAAALPVIGTALVIVAGSDAAPAGPTALLSRRPVTLVGDISYSLYLVHWPILLIAQAAVGPLRPLSPWLTGVIVVGCVPVAWLLYRCVEQRGLASIWFATSKPRRILLLSLVATTLVAAGSAVTYPVTQRRDLDAGRTAPTTIISAPPTATPFVPSNLRPDLRSVARDVPMLYANGCHRDPLSTDAAGCVFGNAKGATVALFGDSHAAQWFPALEAIAQDHSLRLVTYTKSSCPSVTVDAPRTDAARAACVRWREAVLRGLVDEPPGLVVLSNLGVASASGNRPTVDWEAGALTTMSRLRRVTQVAVIADTPDLRQTPAICLSAHLRETSRCGVARSIALDSPTRAAERNAAARTDSTLIDLSGYLCVAETCPPIVGDTLVYRDAHHLSATYARQLADTLWEDVGPLLGKGP